MEHTLDNPVWHALTGQHASIAIGRGGARHYPRDMAPFAAIEHPNQAAYTDLAADLPPETEARLFRPTLEPLLSGWREIDAFPMLQMIADHVTGDDSLAIQPIRLNANDIADMLDLVDVSRPGPFGRRTLTLGPYFGVRDGGRLMAMAGIRMRLAGFDELSAICVHPNARGRGYAAGLTRHLMRTTLTEGRSPFLHVRPDNIAAISLYRALGFVVRREIFVVWRAPQA